jgi:HSP20 family molecular chaperone IbpA
MTTRRDQAQSQTPTSVAAPREQQPVAESAESGAVAARTDQDVWPLIESFRVADKFVIEADVPGMKAEEIVVELMEDEVVIHAERRLRTHEGDRTYQQQRNSGPFQRRVLLPNGVRPQTVRASLDGGVLRIEFETKRNASGQGARERVKVEQGKPN